MSELHGKKDRNRSSWGRRAFLVGASTALAGLVWWRYRPVTAKAVEAASPGQASQVTIIEFTDAGMRKGELTVARIQKDEMDWKSHLSADSFEVTRHAGTERAFSGELLNLHDKGVFRCICCDTALFSSDTKFESGTGWPSFWAPIAKENIVETTDKSFGMRRTAVSCRRCDSHAGHVFDDGPPPTGLRYCMNSVSLRFAKA